MNSTLTCDQRYIYIYINSLINVEFLFSIILPNTDNRLTHRKSRSVSNEKDTESTLELINLRAPRAWSNEACAVATTTAHPSLNAGSRFSRFARLADRRSC